MVFAPHTQTDASPCLPRTALAPDAMALPLLPHSIHFSFSLHPSLNINSPTRPSGLHLTFHSSAPQLHLSSTPHPSPPPSIMGKRERTDSHNALREHSPSPSPSPSPGKKAKSKPRKDAKPSTSTSSGGTGGKTVWDADRTVALLDHVFSAAAGAINAQAVADKVRLDYHHVACHTVQADSSSGSTGRRLLTSSSPTAGTCGVWRLSWCVLRRVVELRLDWTGLYVQSSIGDKESGAHKLVVQCSAWSDDGTRVHASGPGEVRHSAGDHISILTT